MILQVEEGTGWTASSQHPRHLSLQTWAQYAFHRSFGVYCFTNCGSKELECRPHWLYPVFCKKKKGGACHVSPQILHYHADRHGSCWESSSCTEISSCVWEQSHYLLTSRLEGACGNSWNQNAKGLPTLSANPEEFLEILANPRRFTGSAHLAPVPAGCCGTVVHSPDAGVGTCTTEDTSVPHSPAWACMHPLPCSTNLHAWELGSLQHPGVGYSFLSIAVSVNSSYLYPSPPSLKESVATPCFCWVLCAPYVTGCAVGRPGSLVQVRPFLWLRPRKWDSSFLLSAA